jgi:hypothetical protein
MTRSDEPLFEPRIADWLEDDPHAAPQQALEVVLAAFPSIKQRRTWRAPWRFTMPTVTKALALGVTALIIVFGSAWLLGPRQPSIATPSPSLSASPRASTEPLGSLQPSGPAMTLFVSPQYGYSVEAPSAYQFIAATETWPAGEALGPETAWTDRFRAGTNFVGIASQPLPEGTTPDGWLDAYALSVETRECGASANDWTPATVGTDPARTVSFECGGDEAAEYAWVVDGRGWVVSGEAAVVELVVPTITLP